MLVKTETGATAAGHGLFSTSVICFLWSKTKVSSIFRVMVALIQSQRSSRDVTNQSCDLSDFLFQLIWAFKGGENKKTHKRQSHSGVLKSQGMTRVISLHSLWTMKLSNSCNFMAIHPNFSPFQMFQRRPKWWSE